MKKLNINIGQIDKQKIGKIILAIYAGCSLSYLFNLMAMPKVFTQSVFSIAMFAILFRGLQLVDADWNGIENPESRKKRIKYVLITGLLLGLALVLGYQLRMIGNTSPGVKGKLFVFLVSGGVSLALSPFVNIWFRLLDKFQDNKKVTESAIAQSEPQGTSAKAKSGKTFLISWGVILLCWLPVFLAYYPAIMSYDFNRQAQEAYQGYIWFNSHHPLIHTFLIRCALLIGEALGSYEVGMAIFSIFQMLVLSVVMAYSCSMIGRLTKKKWPVIASVILFAVLPVHSVLALCMTKDILFSAFFLLLMLLILERKLYRDSAVAKKGMVVLLDVAIVLTGVLVIMFRNNAVYAFAVFAVFYILWSRKERLQILLLCVLIIVGGQGAKIAMLTAMDAGSGSKMEMYSVFVQQMCRVGKNQDHVITREERELIGKYVPYEIWSNYNPTLADSIKGVITVTTFQTWKEDIPGMLQDWASLGLRYPNDYIDAFLELTMGYWFPDDVSNAEVLGVGDDTNLGLIYTFNASASDAFEGVESRSYFPALLELYSGIVNGNEYDNWPVLSNLFKPAFYCWIMVLVMISVIYLKQPKKMIMCMLPFWYLMTLLLGPVVNIRYAYPMMIAAPFLLAWLFSKTGWGEETAEVKKIGKMKKSKK